MKKLVNGFKDDILNKTNENINKLNNIIDYNHCSLNLITSILKYYGYQSKYSSLDIVDKYLDKKYKNVVFMIFDGLGDEILKYHSEFGILNMCKADVIDSVFPPTTVSAITTFETAVSAKCHSHLGWSMYFEEIDKVMDVFLTRNSITKNAIFFNDKYPNPLNKLKQETIFSKIKASTFSEVECHMIYPKKIKRDVVDYSLHKVDSVTEIFDNVTEIVRSSDNEKFIYCYFDKPDSIMHTYGTKHLFTGAVVEVIEKNLEKCLKETSDTLFIITADHGQIDNKDHILLNSSPLWKMLNRRPDIEGRAMNFSVKEEYLGDFKVKFNELYGQYYDLYSRYEVINSTLFGPETGDNLPFTKFIGDYLALAKSDVTMVIKDETELVKNAGSHAGTTINEIKVPLIIIENN